jgi:hypothetical protein
MVFTEHLKVPLLSFLPFLCPLLPASPLQSHPAHSLHQSPISSTPTFHDPDPSHQTFIDRVHIKSHNHFNLYTLSLATIGQCNDYLFSGRTGSLADRSTLGNGVTGLVCVKSQSFGQSPSRRLFLLSRNTHLNRGE